MNQVQRRQSVKCACIGKCECNNNLYIKKIKLPELNKSEENDTESVITKISETSEKNCFTGVRYIQCILLFLGITISYSLRVNISVAIVTMIERSGVQSNFQTFKWNATIKSLLLSSFYWGYVLSQLPGGYLSQRYGTKILLFIAILIASIITIITPVCTLFGGWPLLLTLRIAEGFFQGVVFPSTHTFLAHWAPIEERGRLGIICYSGTPLGTALMFVTSGWIASSPHLGWPGIFYISGACGCVWTIIWFIFAYSTPAEHKSISTKELKYIEDSINENKEGPKTFIATPWKQLFTSPPFISCLVSQCSQGWGFLILLTQIPTYMNSILKKDIESNAILSSLPYFAYFICGLIFIFIRDFFDAKQIMSKNASRKLFNTLGQCVPAVALAFLGFITKEYSTYAVLVLIITCGMNSAVNLGAGLNHIDLAPNHAGILMGLGNGACAIINIIAPLAVGVIVTDETNQNQWRIVFFTTSAIYFFGNLTFVIFGTTRTQPWNDITSRKRSPSMIERKLSIFIEAGATQKI